MAPPSSSPLSDRDPAETLLALPPPARERLRTALATGFLTPPYAAAAIRAELPPDEDAGGVASALGELARLGVSPEACATWLAGFEAVSGRLPRPDLVWSGPEVPGCHGRATRRVVEELIAGAERSLLVSSFVFFDGPRAFDPLARRMKERPALEVSLLLNIQRRRHEDAPADQLVRRFADRFWKKDWPGDRRPAVFYDPRSLAPEGDSGGEGGVLHAKAVVADDESVFVTSANLTEAAFDRNIEVGIVLRDRPLALSVSTRFRALIERRHLLPLPAT